MTMLMLNSQHWNSTLTAGVTEALLTAHQGPRNVSPKAVALGSCLILVNAAISLSLSLGLEFYLIIATIRCVVQLGVLGYVILVPIFTTPYWFVVVSYAVVMCLVGAAEASSRPAYSFKWMFLQILACTVVSPVIFVSFALLVLIRTNPWWEPRYFIPLLGMLLGNCISGMSVGLSALLEELSTGKDRIELLMYYGATRWEAGRDTIARCIKLAMTPILNQMSVVGIVSIPGMMTGSILGGTSPEQAARYQMLILFLIAANTGTGVVLVVFAAYASLVDKQHRVCSDSIYPRKRIEKLDKRLHSWALQAWQNMGGKIQSRPNCTTNGLNGPALRPELEPLVATSA